MRDSHSLTMLVRELLFMYCLPGTYNILSSPFSRPRWKNLRKRCVHDSWLEMLTDEAFLKSTLKFLILDSCTVGKVLFLWKCGQYPFKVTMMATKVWIAVLRCGLYSSHHAGKKEVYPVSPDVVDRRRPWPTFFYTAQPCNKPDPPLTTR